MPDKMQVVTLASGSSGNCTLVRCPAGDILIDAGISMRRIKNHLACAGTAMEKLSGILITHEHSDHISGLPMLIKHCQIPVYAPRKVANHLRYAVAGVEQSLHEIDVEHPFSLAGAEIRAFATPHDAAESVGYRIECGCIFAFATDMGHVTEEVTRGLMGADAVVIEANHDEELLMGGSYPYYLKQRILSPEGHLSNRACAELACTLVESGTRYIILGHLSRENNTPGLALRTVQAALGGTETFLYAAPADQPLTLEWERKLPCLV